MRRKVALIVGNLSLLLSFSWSYSLFGHQRAPRSLMHQRNRPDADDGFISSSLSLHASIVGSDTTVMLNDTIVPNKKRERRKRSLDEPEISADNADAAATVGEEKPNQKTRRRSKAKSSEPEAPTFWFNSTDQFSLVLGSGQQLKQQPRSVRFSVRGSPRPLRRHRTACGFMYNPSSKYQTSFRQVVHQLVWPDVEAESDNHEPLFAEDDQLAMTLVFYMKRPKKHFVSGKPGPGRLRDEAPPRLSPSRTDVDNLAKFVLDSLNGLLYVDDRQVASIQATKLLHDDGECEGCTHVSIYRLTDQDLDALLEPTIPPGR